MSCAACAASRSSTASPRSPTCSRAHGTQIHVNRFVERRGVLGDDGHSDYGRAFTRFVDHYLADAVSSRSTVIICGDARTNYRPDGVEALRAIAEQARRVFWLNPEPETGLGRDRFGDGRLPRPLPGSVRGALAAAAR